MGDQYVNHAKNESAALKTALNVGRVYLLFSLDETA